MDKPFSEELVTGNNKSKINLYLLIFLILIVIIFIIIIIVLSVKLSNKSDDYDDVKKQLNTLIEENNQIKTQYKIQNNTLNDIFHVFQDLISKTEISNNDIPKEKYSNVMATVKSKIEKFEGEGTYDFVTEKKETFTTGFHIDFETPSRNSENAYTEEEYDDLVYKLSCIYGRNMHINYYENIPHISFYCEDRNIAFAMGALFNQKNIWDWEKFEDVPNPFYLPDFF